mgnify:CR=1 FL=1|jgi:hypothetical protein
MGLLDRLVGEAAKVAGRLVAGHPMGCACDECRMVDALADGFARGLGPRQGKVDGARLAELLDAKPKSKRARSKRAKPAGESCPKASSASRPKASTPKRASVRVEPVAAGVEVVDAELVED